MQEWRGNGIHQDTESILEQHGIPVRKVQTGKDPYLLISGDSTNMQLLRDIGFRLGRGTEQFQYILYFGGKFCGFIV